MAPVRNVILVLALVAVAFAAAPEPRTVLAVYKTDAVAEGPSGVSVSFTARVFNMSRAPVRFKTVVLADTRGDASLAEWHDVAIAPEDKVELSEKVSVAKDQYRRWRSGSPAVLLVLPEGLPRPAPSRVDATYQPSGW